MRSPAVIVKSSANAPIEDAAAAWLVALERNPGLEQDSAFQAWLQADVAHARAYHTARKAWQIAADTGPDLWRELAQAEAENVVPLRPARLGPGLKWAGGLAIAASVCGALWLNQVRPDLRLALTADHASRPGELRDFALDDGSRTLLDGGSALDYASDDSARRVTLLKGAAFFDVQKDGRPFTVSLGPTEVRALGTRFGVRDCGRCVEISLEEGSIAVTTPENGEIVLTPGQQLRLLPGQPPHLTASDTPESLAWREGRYAFYDVTLREVVGVLARHGAGAVIFADEAMASRMISGTINLTESGAELQALSEVMGFRLIPLPGGQLIM